MKNRNANALGMAQYMRGAERWANKNLESRKVKSCFECGHRTIADGVSYDGLTFCSIHCVEKYRKINRTGLNSKFIKAAKSASHN